MSDSQAESKSGFTLPQKPGLYIFAGKPSSGKTVNLKAILYNYCKHGYFKFGLVICKTKFNKSYDFMPDEAVWKCYEESRLEAYVKKMETWMEKTGAEKPPPNFVVLDDLLGTVDQYSPFFKNWISCYRHYNTTLFLTAQYMADGISTHLRDSTTMAFLYRTRFGRSVKALGEAYGSGMKEQEWADLLEQATVEEFFSLVFVNDQPRETTYHCYKSSVAPNFKLNFGTGGTGSKEKEESSMKKYYPFQ